MVARPLSAAAAVGYAGGLIGGLTCSWQVVSTPAPTDAMPLGFVMGTGQLRERGLAPQVASSSSARSRTAMRVVVEPTELAAAAGAFAAAAAAAVAFGGATSTPSRGKRAKWSPSDYKTLCKESDAPDSVRRRFELICAEAQEQICQTISDLDGKATFDREPYTRESGGGGVARVLTNGDVFEKAGVNLSVVYGEMPQEALKAATERGADRVGQKLEPGQKVPFFACGLSSVMHPKNPFCPTMHFNYRYFETDMGVWWFGGGTDITPSYLDVSDMKHFHGTYERVCQQFDPAWYSRFKEWADRYFYIKHRGETRGLGGIFFDDFNTQPPEEHLRFSQTCLKSVTDAYVPLLEKHRNDKFTPEQKAWQQMRRGRYVEFNLVYDRGTIFGLKMLPSGTGRIESILMSLPETARWQYCHEPEPGTPEAEIMDAFKNPREWV
mmetsp:Transcript_89260/g.260964  ORF Transcript_89260/g.260964 Transcript_89260/m.260964 type:complete len:438 (-) Transcript_89260:297-1610(-)